MPLRQSNKKQGDVEIVLFFYCVNLESEWQVVAWHIVCGEFRSR